MAESRFTSGGDLRIDLTCVLEGVAGSRSAGRVVGRPCMSRWLAFEYVCATLSRDVERNPTTTGGYWTSLDSCIVDWRRRPVSSIACIAQGRRSKVPWREFRRL
jgi:hypothetical protein